MRYFALFSFVLCFYLLKAQPDSLPSPALPEGSTDILEDFLQNTDSEGVADFNTLFESLNDYRRRPLDLNRADEQDLRDLLLLNDVQITGLLTHRQIAGDLLSIYELQAVPGFTPDIIRAILPFVSVGGSLDD